MDAVIRTDASFKIGLGHMMRCLTLAKGLRNQGVAVTFICRDLPGHTKSILEKNNFEVFWLPETAPESTQVEDAKQTVDLLSHRSPSPDWLIVDHFEFDATWEKVVRPFTKRLFVIDDLANRSHECDMLLDQTYDLDQTRYQRLLPAECRKLFGSSYVLLQPEFTVARAKIAKKEPNFKAPTIHVYFGGANSDAQTLRYSRLLVQNFPLIRLHIIVHQDSSALDALVNLQKDYPGRIVWKKGVENMAEEMVGCDLAFGSPGITTWERACLGLPSAYLAVHVNQVEILQALAEKGFCRFFGLAGPTDEKTVVENFAHFLKDLSALGQMRHLTMSAVDGLGSKRVVSALLNGNNQSF